jgi:hypothetical protein
MAAIAECTKNPMAIFQYQNDEQVRQCRPHGRTWHNSHPAPLLRDLGSTHLRFLIAVQQLIVADLARGLPPCRSCACLKR